MDFTVFGVGGGIKKGPVYGSTGPCSGGGNVVLFNFCLPISRVYTLKS